MTRLEAFVALGGLSIVSIAASYILTDGKRKEVKKIEQQAKLPPEYWTAKVEEAKASVKKHQMDVESNERMTLDRRNREDAERTAKLEYEKNAPKEYWEHKRIMEEEKTKRDTEHERIRSEERLARKQAETIRDSARYISSALSN